MPCEPLVFAHHPSDKIPVHVLPYGVHRGLVELTVIVRPAPQDWIKHSRQVIQRMFILQLDVPTPYLLPQRFLCAAAYRRGEVDVAPPLFILRGPGSKSEARKSKETLS